MEKKIKQLLDYQKFANENELSDAINSCENNSVEKKEKQKNMFKYKKSVFTMSGSAVAATFLLLSSIKFVNAEEKSDIMSEIGSIFADGNMGFISAGILFGLGIVLSVIFYNIDKKNL